ncbi:MAG: DNA integrity scanning protein DisA nucleotide-binding domain protein [Phycisphaerales bacterium]
MVDSNEIAEQLLEMATELADTVDAARIVVPLDALPDDPALDRRTIIVTRGAENAERAEKLADTAEAATLDVPLVHLDRPGQVNLAMVLALSQDLLKQDDFAVFVLGEQGERADTIHVLRVNDDLGLLSMMEKVAKKKVIKRAVFQRVVTVALALAGEGREGRPVGAIFVIGDTDKVSDFTEQLIINPFRGYPENMRNILDDDLLETIKEFSTIDGAWVVRGDGVIVSAGTLLRASLADEDLPKGLGARHAAAAGITRATDALAISVSQSDGAVRVWRNGRIVTEFERARRP